MKWLPVLIKTNHSVTTLYSWLGKYVIHGANEAGAVHGGVRGLGVVFEWWNGRKW